MPRPAPPVPPQGTDPRSRADRGPRWCASAGRLRASRGDPGRRAARRRQRPRPPGPTRPPASAPSGRLRLPLPRVRPCRRFCSSPLDATRRTEVEQNALLAAWPAREADAAAVPDQEVRKDAPALARDDLHQVALDLDRILAPGEAEPLGE